MPGSKSQTTTVDGSMNWSGGVDSLKVPTLQSANNPDGLSRNQLAWINNATVRDGGITPRPAWKFLQKLATAANLWQGGEMYRPTNGDPYLIYSLSGHILKCVPGTAPVDLSETKFSSDGQIQYYVWLQNIDAGPIGSTTAPGNDSILGSYSSFKIPSVGSKVRVGLAAAYTAGVGITITLGGGIFHTLTLNVNTAGLPAPRDGNGFTVLAEYGNNTTDVQTQSVPGTYIVGGVVYLPVFGGATQAYTIVAITDVGSVGAAHYLLAGVSPTSPQFNPQTEPQAFFCQAEQWMIVQAGDYTSLPFFFDGLTLRRSIGITDTSVAPGTPGTNEIPPGGPMDYYMGRLWYSQGGNFSAGDIVGGNSGTLAYNFRDAVLNVTECKLVLGGDGFSVPSNEGNVTALSHNASQNASLGQGQLFAFTTKSVQALTVPVTRANWIASNSSNQPLMVPIQLADGSSGDKSITAVNGDVFYQSPQGDIRSVVTAVRYFDQWGNIPVSAPENRLLQFNDPSLLSFASGIYFDNRLLQTALPVATPQGVVHQALSVLDFESISQYGVDLLPTWEGMWEGLDILQLFTGVFSGKERAFAVTVSRLDQSIELWELTTNEQFDNVDSRIQMVIEFPAFTWGDEFDLKKLVGSEIWIDRLFGETIFKLDYRPDGESCWTPWYEWKECTPRSSAEDKSTDPCTLLQRVSQYPIFAYGESYRQTLTVGKPPEGENKTMIRPSYIGYQFQTRLTVIGFCRVRGLLLYSEHVERKLYDHMVGA